MKAINVKYLPATDHRGTRLKASTSNHSVTVSFDYALGNTENEWAAAEALCKKLGWDNELAAGNYKDETYFVLLDTRKQT